MRGRSRRSPRSSDCTLAQLAIAWCAKNPHVSSVITGASRVEQVHENLAALDVLPKLTDDVMARIDADHRLSRAGRRRRSAVRPGSLGARPGAARPLDAPPRARRAGQMGQLEDLTVDPPGQVEREEGGRDLDQQAARTRASRTWPRLPEVVTSNQASTKSSVAVAVAGNCTLGSIRKAM